MRLSADARSGFCSVPGSARIAGTSYRRTSATADGRETNARKPRRSLVRRVSPSEPLQQPFSLLLALLNEILHDVAEFAKLLLGPWGNVQDLAVSALQTFVDKPALSRYCSENIVRCQGVALGAAWNSDVGWQVIHAGDEQPHDADRCEMIHSGRLLAAINAGTLSADELVNPLRAHAAVQSGFAHTAILRPLGALSTHIRCYCALDAGGRQRLLVRLFGVSVGRREEDAA